jgi:hypothetical protein
MKDKLKELFYETIADKTRYYDGNLIDVLASERGWSPLEIWEEMTVTLDRKRYVIVRIEDNDE